MRNLATLAAKRLSHTYCQSISTAITSQSSRLQARRIRLASSRSSKISSWRKSRSRSANCCRSSKRQSLSIRLEIYSLTRTPIITQRARKRSQSETGQRVGPRETPKATKCMLKITHRSRRGTIMTTWMSHLRSSEDRQASQVQALTVVQAAVIKTKRAVRT